MVTVKDEISASTRPNKRLARITGALYLTLGVVAMFAALTTESVAAPADIERATFGVALVAWIGVVLLDIVLSVTFYLLLRPVNRTLSLLTAGLRLAFAGILGAVLVNLYDAHALLTSDRLADLDEATITALALSGVDRFNTGFLMALVIFGVYVMLLGYLFYRSRYVPRALSVVVLAAGAGYIVDSLARIFVDGYGGVLGAILVVIMIVGEVGLAAWLLVKGVRGGE